MAIFNIYKSLFVLAVFIGTVSSAMVQKRDSSAFMNTLPPLTSAVSTFAADGFSATGTSVTPVNVSTMWQVAAYTFENIGC
jgi:hypothetical protein